MDFLRDIPPGWLMAMAGAIGLVLQKLVEPAIAWFFDWLKSRAGRKSANLVATLDSEAKAEERLQAQLLASDVRYAELLNRLEEKSVELDAVQEAYHKAEIEYTRELGKFDVARLQIQMKCDEEKRAIRAAHEAEIRKMQDELNECERLHQARIRELQQHQTHPPQAHPPQAHDGHHETGSDGESTRT